MKDDGSTIQEAVGALIKKRRMAVGMSQEALSTAVGLSRSSVANIECGRQKIGVPLLYAIANLLQTTPHELLPIVDAKPAGKGEEIRLPDDLPAGDKDWIRGVLNPGRKKRA